MLGYTTFLEFSCGGLVLSTSFYLVNPFAEVEPFRILVLCGSLVPAFYPALSCFTSVVLTQLLIKPPLSFKCSSLDNKVHNSLIFREECAGFARGREKPVWVICRGKNGKRRA